MKKQAPVIVAVGLVLFSLTVSYKVGEKVGYVRGITHVEKHVDRVTDKLEDVAKQVDVSKHYKGAKDAMKNILKKKE